MAVGVYRDVCVDGVVDYREHSVDCVVDRVMLFRFILQLLLLSVGATSAHSWRRFVGVTLMVVAFFMVILMWCLIFI